MAKSSKRSLRRRRTHHSHRSRRSRSHGGVAPVSHNDVGWSSKMSNGQGGDYLSYHSKQHGGALQGADVSVLGQDSLPSQLRASAHLGGLDKSFEAIRGLSDHSGGRRTRRNRRKHRSMGGRKHGKKSKSKKSKSKKSKKSKSKKSKRSRRTRRGGAMGYSPFPSSGMLLSQDDASKAGLNPHWRDVEVNAAAARARM